MGNVGDLWQIRTVGQLYGQEINNIFWFKQLSTGGVNDASEAAEGLFFNKLSPALLPILHVDFAFTAVVATNWTTGLEQDVHILTAGNVGLITAGDCMPSMIAWTFKYQKSQPLYSSGGKRFAGVPETKVDGNTVLVVGDEFLDVQDSLQTGLVFGGFVARPVVLVTQLNGVPKPTAMGAGGFVTWDVNTVIFNGVSTQRSRLASTFT